MTNYLPISIISERQYSFIKHQFDTINETIPNSAHPNIHTFIRTIDVELLRKRIKTTTQNQTWNISFRISHSASKCTRKLGGVLHIVIHI